MRLGLKKSVFLLAILGGGLPCYGDPAPSEDNEIKELKIIIRELQERLKSLEAKKASGSSQSQVQEISSPKETSSSVTSSGPTFQENKGQNSLEKSTLSPQEAPSQVPDLQQPEPLEPSGPISSTFDSFHSEKEDQWVQGPMPKKPISPPPANDSSEDPYTLGHASLKKGEITRARSFFSQVSPQSPHYGHALYWLGTITMLQDKDNDKASFLFSKAYTACKDKKDQQKLAVSVLLKLTECLHQQGKIPAARVILQEAKEKATSFKDKAISEKIREWTQKLGKGGAL
jgi:TolA-binding protein